MSTCLEKAINGDTAATTRLVEQLRPRLEKMAIYYARRCGEDADDLLQEAWLGLLQVIPALNPRIGQPEQFLIKRARWRLLDAVKRARIRRCASLEEDPDESQRGLTPDEGHSTAAASEFLSQLPGNHRTLVEHLLEGLTWREAGAALGCTSANVAYHMRQIRRRYHEWAEADRSAA